MEYHFQHKKYKSIYDIVGVEKNDIISFVGGGGKTSSLLQFSKYLTSNKISHIIVTTTNMMAPVNEVYNDIDGIIKKLNKNEAIWVGEKFLKNSYTKIRQPKKEVFDFVLNSCNMPILIEADGAKCLPIKINRDFEPVIIKETTKVISVVGIDAMKYKIRDIAFKYEAVCEFVKKNPDDYLDEHDIVKIIESEKGLSKSVTPSMKHYILINKCDTKRDEELAIKIKNLLNKDVIYGTNL